MTNIDDMLKHADGIAEQTQGRTVAYTAGEAEAVDITAVQGEISIEEEKDDQGAYQLHTCMLAVSLSNIAAPADGDVVVIAGDTWDVDGVESKDESVSNLNISRRTNEKRHTQDFHRRTR